MTQQVESFSVCQYIKVAVTQTDRERQADRWKTEGLFVEASTVLI